MKKYLLAILPLAVFAAGCEDPCERGIALRNDQAMLEAVLYETLLQPTTLPATCYAVSKTWSRKLIGASRFASKMADEHFYSAKRECTAGHYEQRCFHPGYPDRNGPFFPRDPREPYFPTTPRLDCRAVYVCDHSEVIVNKKDGYEQAKRVAVLLYGVRHDMLNACKANASGDVVGAMASITKAKSRLPLIEEKTDYVLSKAGCFDRRGH